MKLVTKIRLSFFIIFIGMLLQSLITYMNVSSIGSELEEISEYQVPLNSLVMELEKDILEEELLTYKLLLYAKDTHSEDFINIEHKIQAIEKETDEKMKEVLLVVATAISHSHESKIKQKYEEIQGIFQKINEEQKVFEHVLKELEHDLSNVEHSKLEEHQEIVENVLENMAKEIIKIASIMEHLLENSTHQALEHEHAIVNMMLITNVLALLFIVIVGYILTSQFTKSIQRIERYIENITNTQDLSKLCKIVSKDEIGLMSGNLNSLISCLRDLIQSTKDSSSENSVIAHELSTTSLLVGTNVENSVQILEDAAGSAKDVEAEIEHSIEDAQKSKDNIVQANDNLAIARDNVISLTNKVQESAQAEAELAHNMDSLSKDASEVKNVLTIISDIADQTNLLALNAAIEAARAGEHGRGFAVVADEVRKLAERTQKTLTEINATINVVVQAIGDASTRMETNSTEIQELATLAQDVEAKIDETVGIVSLAAAASDKTVVDFNKTGTSVKMIVSKVQEINSISVNNARSVEEIASASEHLNKMTEQLNQKLEAFRT